MHVRLVLIAACALVSAPAQPRAPTGRGVNFYSVEQESPSGRR